jgi:hypothetical protein
MSVCSICGEDTDSLIKCKECGARFCEYCGDHEDKLCDYCYDEDTIDDEDLEDEDKDWPQ